MTPAYCSFKHPERGRMRGRSMCICIYIYIYIYIYLYLYLAIYEHWSNCPCLRICISRTYSDAIRCVREVFAMGPRKEITNLRKLLRNKLGTKAFQRTVPLYTQANVWGFEFKVVARWRRRLCGLSRVGTFHAILAYSNYSFIAGLSVTACQLSVLWKS